MKTISKSMMALTPIFVVALMLFGFFSIVSTKNSERLEFGYRKNAVKPLNLSMGI